MTWLHTAKLMKTNMQLYGKQQKKYHYGFIHNREHRLAEIQLLI